MAKKVKGQITIVDLNDGNSAKVVTLTTTRQILVVDKDGTAKDKTAITVFCSRQNIEASVVTAWSAKADGNSVSTASWTSSNNSIIIPVSAFASVNQIVVTASCDGVGDTMTLAKIQEKTGEDAYTVILTNESHTIVADADGKALASVAETSVLAFKGTTKVACTIGTISGLPTGMTVQTKTNGTSSTDAYIKFNIANTMTTASGTVSIPLTIDGKVFTKLFTYGLAKNGRDGRGIESISEDYGLSATAGGTVTWGYSLTTATAAWGASKPYLWNRETLTYTDSTTKSVGAHIIAIFTVSGRGISSIAETYAASSQGTSGSSLTYGSYASAMASFNETNRFLWQREIINYTSGDPETKYHVVAVYGVADPVQPNMYGYDCKLEATSGADVIHTKDGFCAWAKKDASFSIGHFYVNVEISLTQGQTYAITGNVISPVWSGTFWVGARSKTQGWLACTFVTQPKSNGRFHAVITPTVSDIYCIVVQESHDSAVTYDGRFHVSEFKVEKITGLSGNCTPYIGLAEDSILAKPNILVDSANFTKKWEQRDYSSLVDGFSGSKALYYAQRGTVGSWVNEGRQFLSLVARKYYCLSFYAKGTGQMSVGVYFKTVDTICYTEQSVAHRVSASADFALTYDTVSEDWKRHVFIFRTPADVSGAYLTFFLNATSNKTGNKFYFCLPKLEEGDKPTEWVSNEEDKKGEPGDPGEPGEPGDPGDPNMPNLWGYDNAVDADSVHTETGFAGVYSIGADGRAYANIYGGKVASCNWPLGTYGVSCKVKVSNVSGITSGFALTLRTNLDRGEILGGGIYAAGCNEGTKNNLGTTYEFKFKFRYTTAYYPFVCIDNSREWTASEMTISQGATGFALVGNRYVAKNCAEYQGNSTGSHNSVATMIVTFKGVTAGTRLAVEFGVNSEAGCDVAYVSAIGNTSATYNTESNLLSRSGASNHGTLYVDLNAGDNTLLFGYRKDGSVTQSGEYCRFAFRKIPRGKVRIEVTDLKVERAEELRGVCTQFGGLAPDTVPQGQNILLDTQFTSSGFWNRWGINGTPPARVLNMMEGIAGFFWKFTTKPSTNYDILGQNISGRLKPSTWYTLSYWCRLHDGGSISIYSYVYPSVAIYELVQLEDGVPGPSKTDNYHCITASDSNSAWKKHTVTFKTAPTLPAEYNVMWRIKNEGSGDAYREFSLCMPKLEECERATTWCQNEADKTGSSIRPRGEYSAAETYVNDSQYRDVVMYNGSYYVVKRGVSSVKNIVPTNTSYWEAATEFQFVATDLLLSNKIYAKVLDAVNARIDELVVKRLQTASPDCTISMEGGLMQVSAAGASQPNIVFGLRNGYAVMEYYDNDGNKLYDLGPSGILYSLQTKSPEWVVLPMKQLSYTSKPAVGAAIGLNDASTYVNYYIWNSGWKALGDNTKKYINPDNGYFPGDMAYELDAPSSYDGKVYQVSNPQSSTNPKNQTAMNSTYYFRVSKAAISAALNTETGQSLYHIKVAKVSNGTITYRYWQLDAAGKFVAEMSKLLVL